MKVFAAILSLSFIISTVAFADVDCAHAPSADFSTKLMKTAASVLGGKSGDYVNGEMKVVSQINGKIIMSVEMNKIDYFGPGDFDILSRDLFLAVQDSTNCKMVGTPIHLGKTQ